MKPNTALSHRLNSLFPRGPLVAAASWNISHGFPFDLIFHLHHWIQQIRIYPNPCWHNTTAQKFPAFITEPKASFKSRLVDTQVHAVHTSTNYFLNFHLNTALSSHTRLDPCVISSLHIFYAFLISPIYATCTAHPILLDLLIIQFSHRPE